MGVKTFDDIIRHIKTGNTERVYLIHGDEPFFIDRISDVFGKNMITDEARDFDLSVRYGQDCSVDDIISDVMSYPMLSKIRLTIIREAQNMNAIDKLSPMINEIPVTSTLVICHKKKFDKRKSLYKEISESGVVFESSKIYDSQLPDFIIGQFKQRHLVADQQSAYIMSEYIGNNLENIVSEIEKISITKSSGSKITQEDIADNIGISKEYNVFELQKAIACKNTEKIFSIVFNFIKNEKQNPLPMVLNILFKFFSNLLIVCYLPNKSEKNIADSLKIPVFSAKEYFVASQHYGAMKCFDIIRHIRISDAKFKGIGMANATYSDIIKELIVFIIN